MISRLSKESSMLDVIVVGGGAAGLNSRLDGTGGALERIVFRSRET